LRNDEFCAKTMKKMGAIKQGATHREDGKAVAKAGP
jgi:hypothetical protein